MEAFISSKGITVCPPGMAAGLAWHKPTASGGSREETEWLTGKESVKCNEENLAKAKILTMIKDLGGRIEGTIISSNKAQNYQRIRSEAFRWFFEPKSDFEDWCITAGYEPDYVREKARAVYENGLPEWRAKAGEGVMFEQRKKYREKAKRNRGEP